MADAISVYDLIPATDDSAAKPKKSGGLKVADLNKPTPKVVPSPPQGPLQKFASQAPAIAKTAVKSFIDDPEATTLAAGVTLFRGAVSMLNTAASGVAALAKTMVTPTKVDPRASTREQAEQNFDQSMETFVQNQKKIQAALEGVNRAPVLQQEKAMQDLLQLIPDAANAIGDSVFEKTGSALASTGALSLATVLTLSPDVATKILRPISLTHNLRTSLDKGISHRGEMTAEEERAGNISGRKLSPEEASASAEAKRKSLRVASAFDELAARVPTAAVALSNHVEQVDPQLAKYMKRRINKFIDASDKELSIIGKNAADAAIREMEGDYEAIRPKAAREEGVSTGEGIASPGRGRRSGPADDLIPRQPKGGKPGPSTTGRTPNASGESAASAEAINRVASEKAAGQDRYVLHADDTVMPLTGVDAVNAKARAGDVIVQRGVGKDPFTILDRGGLSQGLAQGRLNRAVGLGTLQLKPILTAEQVGSTIRTAAKEGTESISKMQAPELPAAEREPSSGKQAPDLGPLYISSGVPVTRQMVEGAFNFAVSAAEKVPGFKIARSKMESLYNTYIETFNPEAKGAPARTAGAAIARNFFQQAQREHMTWEAGKQRRVYWQKMGPKASMEFINGMETGKPFANPIWERARQAYRNWTDDLVRQDQKTYAGSGKDLPYTPRENYVPHLFEDSEGVIRWATKKYGNKWADPKFTKDRTFNLYQEAVDAGFTPKFTNPEEIMQARQFASDIAALRTDLLADLERKGVAVRAAPKADRPPAGFSPNSQRSPTGVRYWVREEADALMYNAFDSASLWNLQGSALKKAISGGFRGWMGVKNALIPIKLGLSLFHPMHVLHIDASATLARETKGVLGSPSLSSIKSFMLNSSTAYLQPLWTNPKIGYPILQVFRGKRAFETLSDADKAAFKDLAEGGMVPTRPREETSGQIQKFKDAVAKRSAMSAWHLPWAVMAGISHPLFGVWIPTLKVASYLKDVKVARELNPEWTDSQRQEAFRQIARKVEARYGEMNYNSLFMDKMLKDIGVATNLSLGWNIGLLDQYVGGAIDLGKATKRIGLDVLDPESKGSEVKRQLAAGTLDRPVFAAYYVGTALMIGGMMHYWFTGKPPEKLIDYTHPQSGEKDQYGKPIRLNTMFYTREFEGLYKHMEQEGVVPGLGEFVKNKGSGMMEMSRTALTGIDSLGNDIRNPEDPAYKQFEQTLFNTLSGLDPISVEAIRKSVGDHKIKDATLSVLGFTPAGKYISETVIEGQIADRFNRYVRPKEKPFQAIEMGKDVKQLREMFLKDDPKYDEKLETAAKKYDMSDKDIHRIEKLFNSPKEAEFDPSIYMFQKLPWEIQKPLLDKMSEEERATYLPHISKSKRAKYERETEGA